MPRKVEVSHKTIIFTILFILGLWVIFQIKDVILLFFVSFIIMSALKPAVDGLEKLHLPRGIAIVTVYLLLWGIIGTSVASLVPLTVEQTSKLIKILPAAISKVEFFSTHQQEISRELLTRIGTLPENLLKLITGIFSNIITVFTTLVISFYLLLERKRLEHYLESLLGHERSPLVVKTISQIESRLGNWVRGELILMLVVGLLTYTGLLLLGIDIALPLAVLAGILELIPNIGPTISAVPAVLIALTIHPFTALATVALYFLVQLLENNLLVPKVMQKAVGINPLVSILALLIGFRLGGPAVAVLAIPIVLVVHTLFKSKLPGDL